MSSWLCAYCARRGRCPLRYRVRGRCPYFVPGSPDVPGWVRGFSGKPGSKRLF